VLLVSESFRSKVMFDILREILVNTDEVMAMFLCGNPVDKDCLPKVPR